MNTIFYVKTKIKKNISKMWYIRNKTNKIFKKYKSIRHDIEIFKIEGPVMNTDGL